MAGGGGDRLSDLADDILYRILQILPVREAASTSLLSRRWAPLWRSSGAVNLVERINIKHGDPSPPDTARRRDAFLRFAGAALKAAAGHGGVVTRLAVDVECPDVEKFLNGGKDADLVNAVVSHPAARRVEELRLRAAAAADDDGNGNSIGYYSMDEEEEEARWKRGYFTLRLPFTTTLRSLDIAGCKDLAVAAALAAFTRLQTLRREARPPAAPHRRTVHFESVVFDAGDDDDDDDDDNGMKQARIRLRLPAVTTTLVLESCGSTQYAFGENGSIGVDAPNLRSFRYKGFPRRFFKSLTPDMTAVNLHFLGGSYFRRSYDVDTTRVHFWNFVGKFPNAKTLKLTVRTLDHLAVATKANRAEILPILPNLECLELKASGLHNAKKSAVAIANLLRCCPALRDLTLELHPLWERSYSFLDRSKSNFGKFQSDFDESVNQFERCKLMNPTEVSLIDGNGDRHDDKEEISDVPALSGRSFTCLKSSLRKVSLRFMLRTSNCFGLQLVKFFAQNAKVLEELCIDSGDRKLGDHMNLSVEKWVAANSSTISLIHKNFTDSSWKFARVNNLGTAPELERRTTSFTVLPLKRMKTSLKRLAKFIAENAMVLEEMNIDDGSQNLCRQMNHRVGIWVANQGKRRKLETGCTSSVSLNSKP
uniref:F-box domain-containing protein n=1 Tax=Leersia perrieri TaxID=77586 RepID=A0A0D9XUM3_9ORYZ